MLVAAFHDLVWRKKRFAIAMAATALVFAMSLVMSGLAASFPNETRRMDQRLGAGVYLADASANGPFYSGSVIAMSLAPTGSAGVLFAVTSIEGESGPEQAGLFGVEPGKLGNPRVSGGRTLQSNGEAVVSTKFGKRVGETLTLASLELTVVGLTNDVTIFGGQGTVFLTLHDAQLLRTGGQPVATMFLAPVGTPTPAGLKAFTAAQARADLLRPMLSATDSVTFVTILLWIVAACIIGSVVFLSAMERTRDFAVFKATGASTQAIAVGLVAQAVVLALVASLVAIALGLVMAPFFPMPVEIPLSAIAFLPVLAIAMGCLASLIGLRKAMKVPPGLAFSGAT